VGSRLGRTGGLLAGPVRIRELAAGLPRACTGPTRFMTAPVSLPGTVGAPG